VKSIKKTEWTKEQTERFYKYSKELQERIRNEEIFRKFFE